MGCCRQQYLLNPAECEALQASSGIHVPTVEALRASSGIHAPSVLYFSTNNKNVLSVVTVSTVSLPLLGVQYFTAGPLRTPSMQEVHSTFATFCHILPHFATRCHILPHFATFCHTLPHFATFGERFATFGERFATSGDSSDKCHYVAMPLPLIAMPL